MAKPKRAQIPDDTFEKQSSALDRLTSPEPVIPPVIEQQYQEPAQTLPKTKLKKISVYLTAEQERKLDDLAYEHRKATGESTNRVDVVRMLIGKAALDLLLE
jgi:hypothetical protein